MSADSPNRSRTQIRSGGPSSVSPQQVTDPTILDSVAGFINEVVPTSYNVPCEIDDQIQWARFEQLENDCCDGDSSIPAALILILGYTTGIQIWAIPASGEAIEILSWRHGSCRVLKIIPTPHKSGNATNNVDLFATTRPLIALCDSLTNYSTLTFRSLKTAVIDPVKQIQFKNSISNVLANRHSIVVSFSEKIAVFDAFTLENRASITTCYLSPGIQPNPIALGSRWLAYAEKKLITSNRSSGGNEGEGVQSYTATVLHAAKSLGRGLRELTETVAGSLTGNPNFKPGILPTGSPQGGGFGDIAQKGIVTILDIENKCINAKENVIPQEAVIAHFVAHTEAIVCLSFDPTGMLLLTGDKRGHDFHLFRIQSHPGGPQLAAVHHLYVLHRGDTSAKIQDMSFSPDSRWITVSTLRGTTHVFPVTPYGGNISVRTHATAHVVNKMSRYQRSAGLTSEGRSSSPVSLIEMPVSLFPYRNPRFPPYPQPTIVNPLAQIRQPLYIQNTGQNTQRVHATRPRLTSSSSDDTITLRIVSCFGAPRAWMETSKSPRETTHKQTVKAVESLFIMSCNGTLVQYNLDPLPLSSVSRERVCNDTAIELKVCARAQWLLQRQANTGEVSLPMADDNLNLITQDVSVYKKSKPDHNDDHWLSQVEIVTHLGPHRRLWMGPQFTFKTYTITNGAVVETRPIDVRRSKPVNMPVSKANAILIESGSANSCEQLFLDTYHKANEEVGSAGELQLKEELADAMLESPGIREGGHCVIVSVKPPHATHVNPLGTVVTLQSDDEAEVGAVEEGVIHENCDEALFRPVVAPKAVFYSESKPKPCPPDNILTKSVEPNTQLAVKIINNKTKQKSTNLKHINATREKLIDKNNAKMTTKINQFSDPFTDKKPQQDPLPPPPPPSPPLDDNPSKQCDVTDNFDLLSFKTSNETKNDDFFDSITKTIDKFEESSDCADRTNNSSEEEKLSSIRKSRRPKTKLGVKIPNANKENKIVCDETIDVGQPKRAWNNIVAATTKPEKFEEEIVDFTFKLPKKDNVKEDLIDYSCHDIENIDKEMGKSVNTECMNLIKIDNKSSDDEKVDNGSSPSETTESSDDSSKMPAIASIMDTEEDSPPTQSIIQSKTSKKKSKKKRR